MSQKDNKILFLLMPNDFNDTEFLEPYNLLLNEGYKVDVAGISGRGVAIGSQGHEHHPNKCISKMSMQDFDHYQALVIPGGVGSPDYLWENEEIQDIVRYFSESGKLVATICYACIVPVQAEILAGKTITVFPTEETKMILKEHDVLYTDQGCVTLTEDKMIFGQGPTHAQAFAQEIVAFLQRDHDEKIKQQQSKHQ